MTRTGSILGLTLFLTAITPAAFAADRAYNGGYGGNFNGSGYNIIHNGYNDDRYNRGRYDSYDYAKVIDWHPVYETVRNARPQRECYDEPARYYNNNNNNSYTGIITGGILGGVLGNQAGAGRGQDIAAIAGTVLGGSIGRDLTRGNNYRSPDYRQRCEVVDHYYEERRPAGYHVTYWYNGRAHETRTDYRPGDKIRIPASYRQSRYEDDDND